METVHSCVNKALLSASSDDDAVSTATDSSGVSFTLVLFASFSPMSCAEMASALGSVEVASRRKLAVAMASPAKR